MWSDILQATVIISMLTGMMRVATPILLAALGELITERAGILNLGVEGIILTGAFVGFLVAHKTGSSFPVVMLAAMIAGGMMSLIMVFMASTLKVDQIVTGLALNLLASGITFYWFRVSFNTSVNIPTVTTMKSLEIPLLSEIPVLGEVLFSQTLLTYIAFLLVPVVWFILNRTKYGLEIRILGENPKAIDIKGINVTQRQYMAAIFGGMLGGLGGASLTVASAGIFLPDMSAGRGWLAIVVVIAGNWRPFRIMLATLVFSFLDAFQLQAQSLGVEFPFQILLALPYILAIGFMVATRARSEAPRHLGRPYSR